jgi:heavy metal translocating P-type ATPase
MAIPIAALTLLPAGVFAIAPAQRVRRRQGVRRLKQAATAVDVRPGSSPQSQAAVEPGPWERALHQLIQARVDPLLGGDRERHLRDLSGRSDELVLGERERAVNLRMAFSTLLLAVSIVTLPLPFWVRALTCLPMAAYLVRGELELALDALVRQRRPSVALLNAFYQTALWLGGYYVVGASLFVLGTLGGKISSIAQDRSQQGLADAFGQHPQTVWVAVDGTELEVPFEAVKIGDTVVVHAGEMIPIDGRITHGSASVDQHRLTGEAQPADKGVGDEVLASTLVLAGSLHIRADQAGSETVAAKIGELLNNTASYQLAVTSKAERLADEAVRPTFAVAGVAGLLVGYQAMVAVASTMMGIGLRMSGPIALLNYLNRAARGGILIKDGRSLELLTSIDTVVFDKSGTLTLDEQQVVEIDSFDERDGDALLTLAAAVEQRQSHPVARAILACAAARNLPLPAVTEPRCELGFGMQARVRGELVQVGSERFMIQSGIDLPPPALARLHAARDQGRAMVMIAVDGRLAGAVELEARLRPEAADVLAALRRRGLKLYIISGDQEEPTRRLAETLGIDDYHANTLPADKAALVEQLQRQGRSICFVGDGINDSIALKKANVSVSLTGATRVATDTAQVVLLDGTLRQLPGLFHLAAGMERNFQRGLAIATVPVLGIWGGVLFLHLGVLGAAALFELSLWAGIANALRPVSLPQPAHVQPLAADQRPPRLAEADAQPQQHPPEQTPVCPSEAGRQAA